MSPSTELKPISVRKPLRNLPNNDNEGGRLSKSANLMKKSNSEKQMEDDEALNLDDDSTLDSLLLAQSNLSSLLQQIDELVVQAFKVKTTSKQGRKEVESFTSVLSDMLSTLRPWVPRFQKVLESSMESEQHLGDSLISKTTSTTIVENACEFGSPEDEISEYTLISPSPLVSWRANCTVERSRQLFLLTPLPKALSSKCQDTSKSLFQRMNSNNTVDIPPPLTIPGDADDDLLERVEIKLTPSKRADSTVAVKGNTPESSFVSSQMFSERDHPMLLMTPCSKMSPPRSCVMLEPISECHKPNARFRKSTPFPVRHQTGSESSDSASSEDSADLAFKYPELLGIHQASKALTVRKDLETSPLWKFSPPKSCVLLEPTDEISTGNAATDGARRVDSLANLQLNQSKLRENENYVQSGCHQTNTSCIPEPFGGNSALIESTPLWKEPESTFRMGKRPGENTLKKELWTRFEAASSTFGHCYNASAIQGTHKKGFLDMLEEACCDEETLVVDGLT